ncbi:lantibiotic dehydratase [Streptomyces sp. NPDC051001]|uniref:lantibiotic dehydratase n=1 Tax=Streptomyces sp. NPDC051001 TaxID=3155795 RepID=UPI00342C57C8
MSPKTESAGRPARVRLGDSRWFLHRDLLLRSAGFPAADMDRLSCPELGELATGPTDPREFAAAYAEAERRIEEELRALADDPRLREAVTWQNPKVRELVLDKLTSGEPMSGNRRRRRQNTLVSYLQRYTVKNDSIGFYGPFAWGTAVPQGGLTVRPGAAALASRSVYFEWWAIDVLARAMSADPDVLPWLRPRLGEAWSLRADGVCGPRARLVPLDAANIALLGLCDGTRTVRDVTTLLSAADVPTRLHALAERGIVIADLTGPVESHPELTLRNKIVDIGDAAVRDRLLNRLEELTDARSRVAEAAGDADKLALRLEELNEVFERITGSASSRCAGEMYAGRTIVYEDTARDLEFSLGPDVLDQVAAPLELVLDAAGWLAGRAAELYTDLFSRLYDNFRDRLDSDEVPLEKLVSAATPDLAFAFRSAPPLVSRLTEEFRARWSRVLRTPDGVREHTVQAAEIAARVREEFPAAPAAWSSARYHAPDLMIAAASPEAVARGDFHMVLGEIHVGVNTLEARAAVQQHPDPDRLLAAAEADHGTRRIFPVPSRQSDRVTSRVYPPALLSPDYTYWSMYSGTSGAPGPITPACDLMVRRVEGRLVVRDLSTNAAYDLLEVVGEFVSGVIINAFSIAPSGPHRPRIAIDRLVIAREAWSFKAADIAWATAKNASERLRAALLWSRRLGLPDRVFYQVDGEVKPIYLDFTSPTLLDLAATAIRRATREVTDGKVTFSEMLPAADQCWLPDVDGRRYTSEFRMIFTAE